MAKKSPKTLKASSSMSSAATSSLGAQPPARRAPSPTPSVCSSSGRGVSRTFRNVKYIDEIENTTGSVNGKELDDSPHPSPSSRMNPLAKWWSCRSHQHISRKDAHLYRHQQLKEDELTRSEHDCISRPWAHGSTHGGGCGNSFHAIRYIDEKDECWQSHQNLEYDHDVPLAADYSKQHHNQNTSHLGNGSGHAHSLTQSKHHETMLDVLHRLGEERQAIVPRSIEVPAEINKGKGDAPPIKRTMLEVMEAVTKERLCMVPKPQTYSFKKATHKKPHSLVPALIKRNGSEASAA